MDTAQSRAPIGVKIEGSEKTSAIVGSLQPNTEYRCRVVASTVPTTKEDLKQCESESDYSDPIRTMASGAFH